MEARAGCAGDVYRSEQLIVAVAPNKPPTPTVNDLHPPNPVGSDIDTTNPEAARWYWETIRDKFVKKGFDAIWLDETEPDLPPNGSYFFVGPDTRYFNVYPLFHTSSFMMDSGATSALTAGF